MRWALVVVLVAALCACKAKPAADATAAASDPAAEAAAAADAARPHVLRSRHPLFRDISVPGGPTLRAGLWVQTDKDCSFDVTKSAGAWPNCARSMVVRPGQMLAHLGHWGSLTYVSQTYVLEPGLPGILQLSRATRRPDGRYAYEGLRALSSEPDGRIVRVRMWLPACGPAAPPGPASGMEIPASDLGSDAQVSSPPAQARLWPGLRPSDRSCLAADPGTVRTAVIAAEHADGDFAIEMNWVRDAEH